MGDSGEIHARARKLPAARRCVASNFQRRLLAARLLELSRAQVYFSHPTITIAKIRDYIRSLSVSVNEEQLIN